MGSPDIAELWLTWSKVAALWLGGIWAFWKWGFSEYLRSSREVPALEGPMSVKVIDLGKGKGKGNGNGNGKGLFVVTSYWRNRGKKPVEIDFKNTCVDVFTLGADREPGAKDVKEDNNKKNNKEENNKDDKNVFWQKGVAGEPSKPLAHLKRFYILEPDTESIIHAYFILERGQIYLFRWKLKGLREKWMIERIYDLLYWLLEQLGIVWILKKIKDLFNSNSYNWQGNTEHLCCRENDHHWQKELLYDDTDAVAYIVKKNHE